MYTSELNKLKALATEILKAYYDTYNGESLTSGSYKRLKEDFIVSNTKFKYLRFKDDKVYLYLNPSYSGWNQSHEITENTEAICNIADTLSDSDEIRSLSKTKNTIFPCGKGDNALLNMKNSDANCHRTNGNHALILARDHDFFTCKNCIYNKVI